MSEPLPVICDLCRAQGLTGEAPFADLADLLSFTPVPRRPHANGWTPEMQRGFIAALVATGAPPRAARAIGKHAFGAEQLRRARGGASFAAAWDAALELARERELTGLRDGLAQLAAEQEQERAARRSAILPPEQRPAYDAADAAGPDRPPPTYDRQGIEQFTEADHHVYLAGMTRIQQRLTKARRLLLMCFAEDPARRAAWETLVGPVDWDAAARMEAQDDEPFGIPGEGGGAEWSMRRPDMLMVVDAGLVPDLTGGRDGLAPLQAELDRCAAAAQPAAVPPGDNLSEEEAEAIAAYRKMLIAEGWQDDGAGGLVGPEQ